MQTIILKKTREKSILKRHPWIFSGAIEKISGNPQPGETVIIQAFDGRSLGSGAWSPQSQIAVRMWSFDSQEAIDEQFFQRKLHQSILLRQQLLTNPDTNALRLVNAESDGLPGLIVDKYTDFLVCQFLAAGSEYWKTTIISLLQELIPAIGIYERSDVGVRQKEGLPPTTGLLSGKEPPQLVEIKENGIRFLVDIKNGNKTGFYLDQRENRKRFAEFARNSEILNCFAYTGGFGIYALAAGAKQVTNIETSADALDLLNQNVMLNGLNPDRTDNIKDDVFQTLRRFRDSRRTFDLIVLDPPKFAESQSQLRKASRGYKDINLLAFKLLRSGGILFTFTCSGQMNAALFQKIVADAALDAGRTVKIIGYLSQAADHPIALNFPEGRYLKGLICRAD
jgi:23S rRNA (cytosine1962-C5)-methyltransferase